LEVDAQELGVISGMLRQDIPLGQFDPFGELAAWVDAYCGDLQADGKMTFVDKTVSDSVESKVEISNADSSLLLTLRPPSTMQLTVVKDNTVTKRNQDVHTSDEMQQFLSDVFDQIGQVDW